ncbi:hypothetical protein GCM10022224_002400 [Nonomuraea antimicrobica]|uniref:Chain length determinant protein n=1 Tax=Nonomuraea antimicrobica TaxID=561173 RepID=A0ABP7AY78_9ACTN
MELSDYARRNRRLVAHLIAIPLVAGLGGAGWALTRPADYTHSSEVQVPAAPGQAGAAAVEQTISTFRTLVTSAGVVNEVARQTGVGVDDVRESLTTGRPVQGGQRGTLVRVHFTGDDPEQVTAATRVATTVALNTLLRQSVTAAGSANARAKEIADKAEADLAAAVKKYGGLPAERYRATLGEISRLETELLAPVSQRKPKDIRKTIKTLNGRLTGLAPQVQEYQGLQDAVVQSARKLATTEQQARDVEANLTAATASITPVTAQAVPASRGALVLRAAALSAGVGLLIAALLAVLRGFGGRREVVVPETTLPVPVPTR